MAQPRREVLGDRKASACLAGAEATGVGPGEKQNSFHFEHNGKRWKVLGRGLVGSDSQFLEPIGLEGTRQ